MKMKMAQHTVYSGAFDCTGRFFLDRHEYAGNSYPRDKNGVAITRLASCGPLTARKQSFSLQGGTDSQALEAIQDEARKYSMVDG